MSPQSIGLQQIIFACHTLLHQQFAYFFLTLPDDGRTRMLAFTFKHAHGRTVQIGQQLVFPRVPHLRTGAANIRDG